VFKRGVSPSFLFPSPSPLKERGTKGVRMPAKSPVPKAEGLTPFTPVDDNGLCPRQRDRISKGYISRKADRPEAPPVKQRRRILRIGVLSDTHVRSFDEIPTPIIKALAGVDLIVHAGDFTERAVLDGLRTLGEVRAVCGNMDSAELKEILPQKELFVISGKKIGLVHGSGGPWGIGDRVRGLFGEADIIIYGHSHQPDNQYVQGSLLFNPGRASDSFGLLTIDDDIKAEIIRV
jgi:putative phosphoesterase